MRCDGAAAKGDVDRRSQVSTIPEQHDPWADSQGTDRFVLSQTRGR